MSKLTKTSDRSEKLFHEAKNYMPGGVNSPVRAFKSVGGTPRFIKSAKGAMLTDVDGNEYLDFVGSWGVAILGHAHPAVVKAAQEALAQGASFGAPCEAEVALAQKIREYMPSLEKIRMVNSGTEATMSALRLARAFTKRDKIIKFEGGYHGHADCLLVKAGSGALTLGIPSSPGVPSAATQDTHVAAFNDLNSVAQYFEQEPNRIAAIIVEPMAANMNLVPAMPEFLKGLRELCDHYDALLIFDEVITGFRVALGGAQSLYGVRPDLTALGKIIGGGLPVGAYGGRSEIMDELAPEGPVYQAGTLSGNPVAMAAGLATLKELATPDFYSQLMKKTKLLSMGLRARAEAARIPLLVHEACGLFGLFFSNQPEISRFEHVMACDRERYNQFFHQMLNNNIYLAPSAFEAGFVSIAHSAQDIDQMLTAAESAFAQMSS